jgi:hypothetical protein
MKIEEIHFTQLRRRILKIKLSSFWIKEEVDFENFENNEPLTLIVDASGLTVDYIEEKWIRKKKDFIKLHIAVDAYPRN